MRRRRSTRSVIKLLAAAAVATASIVGLVRLSTPPARGELPLCEDIEEIDTNVLIKPPKQGNAPEQLMDFLRTYKNEHRPGDEDDDDDEKEPGPVAAGLDTYAGEWYSRDAGGTFVLAFTDDPRPHLDVIEGGGGKFGNLCQSNSYAPITIKLAAPIGQRKIVDGLFLPPRPLEPKRLRIPRHYRRDAVASALAALAVGAAIGVAVCGFLRAVWHWRRARDHTS